MDRIPFPFFSVSAPPCTPIPAVTAFHHFVFFRIGILSCMGQFCDGGVGSFFVLWLPGDAGPLTRCLTPCPLSPGDAYGFCVAFPLRMDRRYLKHLPPCSYHTSVTPWPALSYDRLRLFFGRSSKRQHTVLHLLVRSRREPLRDRDLSTLGPFRVPLWVLPGRRYLCTTQPFSPTILAPPSPVDFVTLLFAERGAGFSRSSCPSCRSFHSGEAPSLMGCNPLRNRAKSLSQLVHWIPPSGEVPFWSPGHLFDAVFAWPHRRRIFIHFPAVDYVLSPSESAVMPPFFYSFEVYCITTVHSFLYFLRARRFWLSFEVCFSAQGRLTGSFPINFDALLVKSSFLFLRPMIMTDPKPEH